MRALVLSGGAARGAYEAGVIESLAARERFDIVCGTSIGALNGLALAQERVDRLRTIWSTIGSRGALRRAKSVAPIAALAGDLGGTRRGSFARRAAPSRVARELPAPVPSRGLPRTRGTYDLAPIREVVAAFADLGALRCSLAVVLTNLSSGSAESFFAFRGTTAADAARAFAAAQPTARPLTGANLVDVLAASIALPVAVDPVRVLRDDGTEALYGDGGIADDAPLRHAIDAGATELTVVLLRHGVLRYREHAFRHLAQLGFVMHDVTQERVLRLDLKLARAVNEGVVRGTARPGKRFIDLRVIEPSVPLRLGALQFDDQESIDRVYELGVADGRAAAAR